MRSSSFINIHWSLIAVICHVKEFRSKRIAYVVLTTHQSSPFCTRRHISQGLVLFTLLYFLRSLAGYSTSFLFRFRFSFYILRSIRELLWLYQSGYLVSSAHAQSISISCMPFQYVIGISYIWCTCLRSYSVVQICIFFLNFNFCKPEYI